MRTTLLFFVLTVSIVNLNQSYSQSQNPVSNGTWTKANSPIHIVSDFTIPENAAVSVEPGVEVMLNSGVDVVVLGSLAALGTDNEPIQWKSANNSRWGCITIEQNGSSTLDHCIFTNGSTSQGQRIGMVTAYRSTGKVIIRNSTFTNWQSKATQGYYAAHMLIEHCYFGEGANEAVHGVGMPVEIYYNFFDRRFGYNDSIDVSATRNPDPSPIIKYNVFVGGDDDGIDLDNCDAYVEGNLVMNSRGGDNDPIGISGDQGSQPIIINNVIINCENGIGFKNGADITVINNTIINCDRGIWLHQNPTHATVLNTIIWGDETQTAIRLEPGSTIDVSYSLIQGGPIYPGEGNINDDPLFVNMNALDFHLQPNSPAIDAGFKTNLVIDWDYDLKARVDIASIANSSNDSFIDLGAYEFQPLQTAINVWKLYE
jgi:parallel beta-helix repeat protein